MSREELLERIESWGYSDHEMILADGLEDAFAGVVESAGQPSKVCYDINKCIDIFMERDGMSAEEALEHFEFNVKSAYVGELTPVFLDRTK